MTAPLHQSELMEVAADIDAATLDELRAEAGRRRTPLIGRFDARSSARVGDPVEMVVDSDRLHFFDLEIGAAIAA
jgi:multiple sugar transport system ATP-binding protein